MEKPSSHSLPHSKLNANQAENLIEQEIINYYSITQTTLSIIKL